MLYCDGFLFFKHMTLSDNIPSVSAASGAFGAPSADR